jgi:hypothetical protein
MLASPGDDPTALLPLRLRRNDELCHGFRYGARNKGIARFSSSLASLRCPGYSKNGLKMRKWG